MGGSANPGHFALGYSVTPFRGFENQVSRRGAENAEISDEIASLRSQ